MGRGSAEAVVRIIAVVAVIAVLDAIVPSDAGLLDFVGNVYDAARRALVVIDTVEGLLDVLVVLEMVVVGAGLGAVQGVLKLVPRAAAAANGDEVDVASALARLGGRRSQAGEQAAQHGQGAGNDAQVALEHRQ